MTWLSPQEARALWARIRPHFEQPGVHGAEPDSDGLTYAAHLWQHGTDRLLGIESFC